MFGTWFIPMFAAISLSGAIALLPVKLASSKIPKPEKEFRFEVVELPPPQEVLPEPEPVKPPPKKVVQPKPVVRKSRPKPKRKVVKPKPIATVASYEEVEPVEEALEPVTDPVPTPIAPPPPPPAPKVDLRAYGKGIHNAVVKHQNYPRVARRLELEGKALVEISINQDGTLIEVQIKRSSGHELLDKEALRMVEAATPFDELPIGYSQSQVKMVIPIKFRLRD